MRSAGAVLVAASLVFAGPARPAPSHASSQAAGDMAYQLYRAALAAAELSLRLHDSYATASSDGSARVWDVGSGKPLLELPGNGRGVAGAAWGPGDREIAIGSWDRSEERGVWGTLNVYDSRTGERRQRLEHGRYPIPSVVYTPDGAGLVGGTWDWNLVWWDTRTWADPTVLPPPESPDYKRVNDFALSPDGRELAVAYADGRVRIWSLERREVVRTLHAPADGALKGINDVVYAGNRLVTVGDDLTLRVWDAKTGDAVATLHGHLRPGVTVAASPDGTRLYSGGAEGTIRVWDLTALDAVRASLRVPHTVYGFALDPDERRAVVATWEGWIRIVDVATGAEERAWRAHGRAAVAASWSRNGRWIATTGADGTVSLWEAATGRHVTDLQDVDRQLESLAFNGDGSLLAAPGADASLRVWRVPSGEVVATLTDGTQPVEAVAWATDDTQASASGDGQVRLWSPDAWTLRSRVAASDAGTPVMAFHPSAPLLAVALGRSLRFWDVTAARWASEPSERSAGTVRLAYSPDGARLAAAMGGNVFEVWHGRTGDVLLQLPHTAGAWSVGWTRRDDLILVPLDQTVRLLRGGDGR